MQRANPSAQVSRALLLVGRSLCGLLLPSHAAAQAAGQWRDAEQMYEHTCGYCHGAGVAVELRGGDYPAEYIAGVVRTGLTTMPAFRPSDFSDSDLAALAELIASSPKPQLSKPAGAPK